MSKQVWCGPGVLKSGSTFSDFVEKNVNNMALSSKRDVKQKNLISSFRERLDVMYMYKNDRK